VVSSGPSIGVGVLRRPGTFVAVLLALLVLAAPAAAKVRYASPTGGPPSACNPTPCTLTIAIAGAADGDQVVVLPGTYTAPIELTIEKAIDVGATPGSPAPLINLKGVQLNVKNAGATLHDLRLAMVEESMSRPLNLYDGTVERVIAGGGEFGANGCLMENGLLRDSVCLQGITVNAEKAGTARPKLVNVTADPLDVGTSEVGAVVDLSVLNSILYARTEAGHLPGSVIVDVATGGSVTADLRNSNYATVESIGLSKNYTVTAPGTNGNQTAPPQFVDFAGGDFRELPTSPTIDAGVADPLLGPLDLADTARVQPRCFGGSAIPDIGAYEFVPTEACPSSGDSGGGSSSVPATKPISLLMPRLRRLKFGKTKWNLDEGTATLTLRAPESGMVLLTGKDIVRRRVSVRHAGPVQLLVKARGPKVGSLRREGKAAVEATVIFVSPDRTRTAAVRPLTLKLRPPSAGARR